MTLADVWVQKTDYGDGSADFTLTFADEDHMFSASSNDDGTATVQYEETLSWRGQIRVKEPDEELFKALMVSDEMTEFIEDNGLRSVQRQKR